MVPTIVGVMVQFALVVPAHIPPVQTNDVAAGTQLVVRVEELPLTMEAGAVSVHVGGSVGGGAVTVNGVDALPATVVATMFPGPTVADAGTVVAIWVAVLLPIIAATPPTVTVAPVRLVPLIVTAVPAEPDDGDTKVISGGVTVWQASQLPPGTAEVFCAVTQAASMAAFPLETKLFAHRLLRPVRSDGGAAGTWPDSRLLLI